MSCDAPHPLETDRLRLRPFAPGDAVSVAALAGDARVALMTARIPHPYPPEAAAEFIRSLSSSAETVFAIEEKPAGILVGACGFTPDSEGGAGIGYWLGVPYWGRGYAVEAITRLMRFAADERGIRRFHAHTLAENPRSGRVLEKAGFEARGRGTRDFRDRGAVAVIEYARTDRRRIVLVAALALIDADGRVLIARRPAGKPMAGLWEFPGGKVEPGETPEGALLREIREELGIDLAGRCLAPIGFASHAYPDFHLLMPLFVCRQWKGSLVPREGQELRWVRASRLGDFAMPPADLPLVAQLRDWL